MSRKYQSYEIKVVYQNGDLENISILNETEVDKTSYKEMMRVYLEIKDTYKDKNCNIEFLGSSENGTLDAVLFIKENKEKKTDTIKNNNPIDKALKDLDIAINNIKQRKIFVTDMLSVLEKKQDFLLHKIETLDDEGIKIQSETITRLIRDLRHDRRDFKNEKRIFEEIDEKGISGNLNSALHLIDGMHIDKIVKMSEIIAEQAKETYSEPVEENKLIKEIRYKNQRERINLVSQLKPKYDKVVVDELNWTITCFNKCGSVKNSQAFKHENTNKTAV